MFRITIKDFFKNYLKIFKFNYPKNLTTRRSRIGYFFFRHLYIFERGKGSILGRFTNWSTEAMVLILFVKSYGINPSSLVIFLCFVLAIGFCYFLGLIWLTFSMDKIERMVSAERDPLLNDIHQNLVVKEGKCEKI